MTIDFKKIAPYEERMKLLTASETISRIDKMKVSVLSPKAKDCLRQLNEASSVWVIDGQRFLVVFTNETDTEERHKANVWAMKALQRNRQVSESFDKGSGRPFLRLIC